MFVKRNHWIQTAERPTTINDNQCVVYMRIQIPYGFSNDYW